MALDIGRRRLEREVRSARRQGRPTPVVAIVGGGLSGLATAMQLVRSGVRSFTVIEQSEGVGGTWRDNTYPGSACDVPSHLYSFSFFPKSNWTRRFAEQPEILSYAAQGVVGSGASAIQFVPRVAAEAAEVTIYQRSPNYVGPKKDRAYRDRTRTLFERSTVAALAYRWWIYWTLEMRWLWIRKDSWAGRKLGELFAKGIRADVVSARLPEATVVPDYPVGCKRVLISNDWYPAL